MDKDRDLDRAYAEFLVLDRAYAEADAFHARWFDEWVRKEFEILCKRTDYPKLGYVISRLNDLGIPCLLHGKSGHAAHILWVEKSRAREAWSLLAEKSKATIGGKSLDEIRDDHPCFRDYAGVKPDSIEES